MLKLTLKAARVNAGLTQAEASKLLGISVSTLKSYESYKSFVKYRQMVKISELYKLPFDNIKFG